MDANATHDQRELQTSTAPQPRGSSASADAKKDAVLRTATTLSAAAPIPSGVRPSGSAPPLRPSSPVTGRTFAKTLAASTKSLPPEIMQRVLSFSVPDPSWTEFSLRSRTLRSIALVARSWSVWARHELHRHALLRHDISADLWLRDSEPRSKTAALRRGVRTLRIGGGPMRVPPCRLAEMIASSSESLEELWLATLRDVDLRHISEAINLKALHCVDLTLELPTNIPQEPILTLTLQRLETLVLKDVEIAISLRTIFFQGHTFPRLETLYVDSAEVLTQIFDDRDLNYDVVFPRLRMLSPATDLLEPYFYPDGLAFLNLEEHFFSSFDWTEALPPMPASIRFFRIGSSVAIEDMDQFLAHYPLDGLEMVFLPAWIQGLVGGDNGPRITTAEYGESEGVEIIFEDEDFDLVEFQDTTQPWGFLRRAEWVKRLLEDEAMAREVLSQGRRTEG